MIRAGAAVVIAPGHDRLAAGLASRLTGRDVSVLSYQPHELADQRAVLDADRFELNGSPVAAVVWRVPPGTGLSAGFAEADRSFADSETAAVWLGALSLPGVYAVSRYDAGVWYGGGQWPAWQGWLRQRGVPVSSLRLGATAGKENRWRPFLSSDTRCAPVDAVARAMAIATTTAHPVASALVLAGEIVAGSWSRGARAAADALTAGGVALARVSLDEDDRVVAVDPTPDFRRGDELIPVVERLAESIHEHLRAR